MTPARVSYVAAGGFPGGTSSAVAAELDAINPIARPRLCLFDCTMFRKGALAPQLDEAIQVQRIESCWNPSVVQDDVVILHNPSFLKRNTDFDARIVARHLVVVTHENFARPGGQAPYDVDSVMRLLDGASTSTRKSLAPIGRFNREGVEAWLSSAPEFGHWDVLEDDWFNIFDGQMVPPTQNPRDRRGRISRAGAEKFPSLAQLDHMFPPDAEANVILGGDPLAPLAVQRPHWTVHPFRSQRVEDVLAAMDFFVYFTAPTWRESFGRVIAEAISAGKLVLTDPETAKPFGPGVIGTQPDKVSSVIATHIKDPQAYGERVRQAQADLERYSAQAFRTRFGLLFAPKEVAA